MRIEWIAFNDGYGIVGYGWECPSCGHYEIIGPYYEDVVECEKCHATFDNPDKPD